MAYDADAYRASITPSAKQEIARLAGEVAAARRGNVRPRIAEGGVTGWVIDEEETLDSDEDYEACSHWDLMILGTDGTLHEGKRERTYIKGPRITLDRLSISSFDPEAWDNQYDKTRAYDGWHARRCGYYAFPRYGDRVRGALAQFGRTGHSVGGYATPASSVGRERKRGAPTGVVVAAALIGVIVLILLIL
ncbi:hypothetical protein [Nocardia sp. NPDC049149]|uniref:hypothetical protein n=1 Tax=Nocardia sp. NPDC049149 TaxID=3364315 RepID=UPI003714BE63